jgi:hypothetical protein
VARLLVDAGNELEPSLLESADGPLAGWLEERLAESA